MWTERIIWFVVGILFTLAVQFVFFAFVTWIRGGFHKTYTINAIDAESFEKYMKGKKL